VESIGSPAAKLALKVTSHGPDRLMPEAGIDAWSHLVGWTTSSRC
jgi:hypothetical protein